MARLESDSKGGFYPTPTVEMEYILKRLRPRNGDSINIIDPCCGKGNALAQWKEHMEKCGAEVSDYGIEVEKTRANEAEKIVTNVAKCGYEETRMSRKKFSAMYLNPPFMEGENERTELTFLRDLSKDYIADGGILIFNIPQYVLADVAKILSIRFQEIRLYRFTDENYDSYNQIIVYGVKRRSGIRTKDERKYSDRVYERLLEYAQGGRDALPALDHKDWYETYFMIPKQDKVETFYSRRIEKEDILRSINNPENHLMKKMKKVVSDKDLNERQIKPAMPLKTTHLATAIASGSLPEEMGDHLLVGVSKQKEDYKNVEDEKGNIRSITTTSTKSLVRIFSSKGIFNLQDD